MNYEFSEFTEKFIEKVEEIEKTVLFLVEENEKKQKLIEILYQRLKDIQFK